MVLQICTVQVVPTYSRASEHMKLEKNSIDMTFQVSKDTVPKKKVSKDTSTL